MPPNSSFLFGPCGARGVSRPGKPDSASPWDGSGLRALPRAPQSGVGLTRPLEAVLWIVLE